MSVSQQKLARFMQGVRADVDGYRALRSLLVAQFDAALRHETAALEDLAGSIVELTAELEARREERVALAREWAPGGAAVGMPTLLGLLPPTARDALSSWWSTLEQLVHECKAQNMRNCRLMVEQNEVMRRVLNQEEATYAPG
ncbi:flagellar export chaperone FlgN [Xylophilus sp. GW821-FHT01B05]